MAVGGSEVERVAGFVVGSDRELGGAGREGAGGGGVNVEGDFVGDGDGDRGLNGERGR